MPIRRNRGGIGAPSYDPSGGDRRTRRMGGMEASALASSMGINNINAHDLSQLGPEMALRVLMQRQKAEQQAQQMEAAREAVAVQEWAARMQHGVNPAAQRDLAREKEAGAMERGQMQQRGMTERVQQQIGLGREKLSADAVNRAMQAVAKQRSAQLDRENKLQVAGIKGQGKGWAPKPPAAMPLGGLMEVAKMEAEQALMQGAPIANQAMEVAGGDPAVALDILHKHYARQRGLQFDDHQGAQVNPGGGYYQGHLARKRGPDILQGLGNWLDGPSMNNWAPPTVAGDGGY